MASMTDSVVELDRLAADTRADRILIGQKAIISSLFLTHIVQFVS